MYYLRIASTATSEARSLCPADTTTTTLRGTRIQARTRTHTDTYTNTSHDHNVRHTHEINSSKEPGSNRKSPNFRRKIR